ncbi:AAA family ATPase [Microbacterium sp. ARD31]|uniref:AAA family ATPase n=1 Tax=Microbacterium sp. ARD31 TaxID=2962576 RepID=UPI0028825C06|nr:AAA family ATPase [Microbacterium sp. ARD31]MDT0181451.1 AAA family ATPase [Microbacterium sp. ARD31]
MLPGDPDATTLDGAKAAIADYNALGLNGYLVAVKLVGEPDVLHIRSYLDSAPENLEFADSSLLPSGVRALIAQIGTTPTCAAASFDSGGFMATPDVQGLIAKLEENPNLLLVGPPGTGKTVLLEKLARYVTDPGAGIEFDPDEQHDAWSEAGPAEAPGKAHTVVLHPSYAYDNLVVGLLPEPAEGGGVSVKAVPGALVNLAHYASGGRRALLVLDEFNRGNAAAVLGDTIALLDRDKRGTAHVYLPYAHLGLEVPVDFANDNGTNVVSPLTLPPSLWIVAAMNSSDRSVAPLDAALRRRFTIVEMPPDYEALSKQLAADTSADFDEAYEEWEGSHVSALAVRLLSALNERIGAVLGHDFELGQSNFWHVSGETAADAIKSLARAWDERIVPTLRLAMQDDDDALAAILIAGESTQAVDADESRAAWWKAADAVKLGSFARARLRFNLLSEWDEEKALAELKRLGELA